MNDESLLFGLSAVLAGIATLEFVLAFVYTPALFAVAVPFAAAAYLVWYQASGRLRERVEQGRAGAYRRQAEAGRETGGFGAGPRDTSGRRGGFDAERRGGFGARGAGPAGGASGARGTGPGGARGAGRAGAAGRGAGAGGARGVGQTDGPTPREAYRVLDLDPGADDEAVRRAYREKVKSVHPDRDGDSEEFKRVNEAYEVLQEQS